MRRGGGGVGGVGGGGGGGGYGKSVRVSGVPPTLTLLAGENSCYLS